MKANSNEYIEKAFKRIEDNFRRIGEQHKAELEAAIIKPIHEKIPLRSKWNLRDDCINGKR